MDSRKKYALEVILEIFFIFSYIWIVEVRCPNWLRSLYLWVCCVGFPIFCVWRDQRSFPEFSLDWEAFVKCLRILVWFTVAATVVLTGIAFYFKSYSYDDSFLTRVSEYIFWAFLQQIGVQTFLTYRVGKVVRNKRLAALVSSSLFSLFHFPNPVLMVLSWAGGFFWCLSYLESPNLYAIALSHGWLAVVTLHSVPPSWLHRLRVGPSYWTF